MLDIPKIRAVLDTASRWDMDLEQFACWSHAHLFNPVLPLEELEDTDQVGPILDLIQKKYRSKLQAPQGRQKVAAALQRRGYAWEDIRTALDRFAEDGEDEYDERDD